MGRSIRVGIVVLVVGFGSAIAAHATEPTKQTDAPMHKKMPKNEPSMETPAQQKSRGTPDDGMKSKPTHKGDKGQTDPQIYRNKVQSKHVDFVLCIAKRCLLF
jgi:hypothetical protein